MVGATYEQCLFPSGPSAPNFRVADRRNRTKVNGNSVGEDITGTLPAVTLQPNVASAGGAATWCL